MASLANSDKLLAQRLLSDLAAARQVDSGTGQVSFRGGHFGQAFGVLSDLLSLDAAVPKSECARVAYESIRHAAQGQLSLRTFLESASQSEREYMSRPLQDFVVITEISISRHDVLRGVRVDGCSVSFPDRLPPAFVRSREAILTHAAHSLHVAPPVDYRPVRIATKARSEAAASDRAVRALQLLVALWNLSINQNIATRRSGGRRTPVSTIALGPVHTVHRPSGRASGEQWWYEPDYYGALRPAALGAKALDLAHFATTTRRWLKVIPYHSDLEDHIRIYGRALDEHDWSASFLGLWQALEATTDTGKSRYDVTVRRTAALYTDREYHAAVLEHLRKYRNRLVHSNEESLGIESKLYDLKRYVEDMLQYHFGVGHYFRSLSEAMELLDLPQSTDELLRQMSLLKRALSLRTGRP